MKRIRKNIFRGIIIIIIIVIGIYIFDIILPGLPKNFQECLDKGGNYADLSTSEGVIKNKSVCEFRSTNEKQERECNLFKDHGFIIGSKCPCCVVTFNR
jgi:hypothetical protein